MTTPLSADDEFAALARRIHRPLEALHVVGYFAPETTEAYTDLGLTGFPMGYFASRSAAMGAVSAPTTTATFYVFSPALVGWVLPAAWELASPSAVLDARLRGIDAALRRGLGDLADGAEVEEAAGLALRMLDGLECAGRTLAAAHAALPVPESPLLALWHAITVLREHRGDGHVAALVLAGLDPVEALVTAAAAGAPLKFLKSTRGWSEEQWAEAEGRLAARGLLDGEGALTDEGRRLREGVEQATDVAAAAPYRRLGATDCARLQELARPLARAIGESGILPRRLVQPAS